jgi:predicted Fe-Mo cluster-binding NifX family protein
MDPERPRLAIPIFRSRVAPVLNWCSKMLILGEKATSCMAGQEVLLLNMDAFDRLRLLQTEGIQTLICGAVSSDLLSFGNRIGFHIISGVAGDIDEVLQAYQARELDQPRFWLPGCARLQHYPGGAPTEAVDGRAPRSKPTESSAAVGLDTSVDAKPSRKLAPSSSKGCTGSPRGASGGFSTCPRCGMKIRHGRGRPRLQVCCPRCDIPTTR